MKRISLKIITPIIIILILVLIIIILIHQNSQQSQPNASTIQDFDNYYHNIPTEITDNINATLYQTIKLNTGSNPSTLSDIQIRTSTPYIHQYNHTNQQYYLNFIIDIPSIQQSYRVAYRYSIDPSNPVGGYPFLISCLSSKNQIYPDYGCKDLNPDGLTEDYIQ